VKAHGVGPWTACTPDSLPAMREVVLLAHVDGGVFPGIRAGARAGSWTWARANSTTRLAQDAISHWTPMPLHPSRMTF